MKKTRNQGINQTKNQGIRKQQTKFYTIRIR
jgi:hypothetical protein